MLKAAENKVEKIKLKIKDIKKTIERIDFMQKLLGEMAILIDADIEHESVLNIIEILDKEFRILKKSIK